MFNIKHNIKTTIINSQEEIKKKVINFTTLIIL